MNYSYKTKSAAETKKIAALLAKEILKKSTSQNKNNGAFIIALSGDLGSGKTTFVQGFANGLQIKKNIISATFLIIKNYRLKNKTFKKFYHLDCYRLKKIKELNILGFKEIITDPRNIVLIEWANKIKKWLPKNTYWIKFFYGQKENERIIKIYENPYSH
jgi:tRNA threonylcarbamoyladenosine biosynthesis protein TsaE